MSLWGIVFRFTIMTRQKHTNEISHLHKYSDPLLSTLLKHLWQRLQPLVFLGMTLQAWHTCIWGLSPILMCRSVEILSSSVRLDGELCCTAIFRFFQRCSIWLGHSKTFKDLSRSHSCVALGVCLGLLFYWNVNLYHSLRS